MAKIARQWYRTIKVWGIIPETKDTRREFKRMQPKIRKIHGCLVIDDPWKK